MRPLLALFLLAAPIACRDSAPSRKSSPPSAEFILSAGDSAYWVVSDTGGIRVRGAPIELALLGGRFIELYVVDDDRSFQGADLIGQSVYRRDLRTGDSTRVFADSIIPALARQYAREHPEDRPLRSNEEPDDDPRLRATATLEFLGTHGPFVSYSIHTDVERTGAPLWHTSRHGVIDLRSGTRATLADIVGREAAAIEARRDAMMRSILDSVRSRASGPLSRYRFDPSSFTLSTLGAGPAIAYAIPTAGTGETDLVLPLPLVPFLRPVWWSDVAASLPQAAPDSSEDVWRHREYSVLARYDPAGDGRLMLRDSSRREWAIATFSAPAKGIFWLDRKPMDAAARHALVRAFDEAAAYGVETHIAARPPRALFQFTSRRQ